MTDGQIEIVLAEKGMWLDSDGGGQLPDEDWHPMRNLIQAVQVAGWVAKAIRSLWSLEYVSWEDKYRASCAGHWVYDMDSPARALSLAAAKALEIEV